MLLKNTKDRFTLESLELFHTWTTWTYNPNKKPSLASTVPEFVVFIDTFAGTQVRRHRQYISSYVFIFNQYVPKWEKPLVEVPITEQILRWSRTKQFSAEKPWYVINPDSTFCLSYTSAKRIVLFQYGEINIIYSKLCINYQVEHSVV